MAGLPQLKGMPIITASFFVVTEKINRVGAAFFPVQ